MPHRTRPMTALLVFTGLNVVLASTITPVYDFVCFLPYWERRLIMVNLIDRALVSPLSNLSTQNSTTFFDWRERRRLEREAALADNSNST